MSIPVSPDTFLEVREPVYPNLLLSVKVLRRQSISKNFISDKAIECQEQSQISKFLKVR